jgi:hypothetical protein
MNNRLTAVQNQISEAANTNLRKRQYKLEITMRQPKIKRSEIIQPKVSKQKKSLKNKSPI